MIMMPLSTVYVYVDTFRAVLDRIPCNRDEQRVPGGVVCNGILASESFWVIWYRR